MKSLVTFSIFYFSVVIFDQIALQYGPTLRWVTKPLIVFSLVGFLFYNKIYQFKQGKILIYALIFSCLGDIILLLRDNYFLFGLLSFLITQLMYSILFVRDSFQWTKSNRILSLFLMVFLIGMMAKILPMLGNLKIPVLIYSLVISFMLFFAVSRNRSVVGYSMVVLGSALFVISDSIIGISRFVQYFNLAPVIIMLTYAFAQYLISIGFSKSILQKKMNVN